MQANQIPVKFVMPFAAEATAGTITTPVPATAQGGGRSSLPTGFSQINMTAVAAGGVPPWGADMNGVLYQATAWAQWLQAGGAPIQYDATFQSSIGGYPSGAIVASAVTAGLYWRSTADNNTTNPDMGGAGWVPFPTPVIVAGVTENLTANLSSASNSVTFKADYVAVAASLGGAGFSLGSFSQTLNTSTTGVGGMDTGSPPTSGFVSIYAIYNPTTGQEALLGTVASQTTIYGGSNLPSGYTCSGLVGIWPTSNIGQFVPGNIIANWFYWANATQIASGQTSQTPALVSLASVVPVRGKIAICQIAGEETVDVTANSQVKVGSLNSSAALSYIVSASALGGVIWGTAQIPIFTPQTLYWITGQSTTTFGLVVSGYAI